MPRGIYKRTKKTREKMSKSRIGNPGFWLGKKHSKETRKKMSEAKKGDNHWNYKGITKSTIHPWVVSEKGKAKNYKCEFCNKRQATCWSNIDHKYKKVLSDYKALCWSCHHRWDYMFNNKKRKKKNTNN